MNENCHAPALAMVALNSALIDDPVTLLTLTAISMWGRVTLCSQRARERLARPILPANATRVRLYNLGWYTEGDRWKYL